MEIMDNKDYRMKYVIKTSLGLLIIGGLLILLMSAGCETPAPKDDVISGPPPMEGINEVCNEDECEEMHK